MAINATDAADATDVADAVRRVQLEDYLRAGDEFCLYLWASDPESATCQVFINEPPFHSAHFTGPTLLDALEAAAAARAEATGEPVPERQLPASTR